MVELFANLYLDPSILFFELVEDISLHNLPH